MSSILRLSFSMLLLAPLVWAQFGSGIQGTVVDRTSAVVPGVLIRVTNMDTGVSREVVSSEEGVYRVTSLSTGTYKMRAVKEGFISAEQDSLVLQVDEIRKVDFTLEVGNVLENVTVTGRPTILETEEGRISGTLSSVELRDMPVPNRNVYNLLALQPGVTGRNFSTDNLTGRSSAVVNANGTRFDGNSYSLDNMSTNSLSRGGSSEVTPNVESVEQVRVVSNNFSAEEGRNMGAHVSVISKSGTNQFHGSVWEYFQNNTLAARNFFDASVLPFRRNQFGAAGGGPVIKNRTFFFASYEGLRLSGGQSTTATVETPQFVDFLTRTRPNSIATKLLTQFHPVAYPTFNFRDLGSPLPGLPACGGCAAANQWDSNPSGIPTVGTVRYVPTTNDSSDQFTLRVDHELRPGKDRLYGYFYHFYGQSKVSPVRPSFLRWNPTTGNFGNINETHIFSPTTLNEIQLGVIRYIGTYSDLANKQVPVINITGVGNTFQDTNPYPGGWFPTEYIVKDMLSWTRGSHNIKFGGEFRRMDNNLKHTASYIPNYTFASILAFANDDALQMSRTVDPTTGLPKTTYASMRVSEAGAFVQDDWKTRRNLTINLGVRYEYFGAYTDAKNRLSNFVLGSGSNYADQIANGSAQVVSSAWPANHLDFAPRIGFAWDIGGKGSNVIRGGYGISYDRLATVYPANYRNNPPQTGIVNVGLQYGTPFTYSLGDPTQAYLGYPVDASLATGLDPHNGIRGIRVSLAAVNQDFRQPYTQNWFFGIQRKLPGQMILEVSYLGSAGHHLINIADINRFDGDLLNGGRFHGLNQSFSGIFTAQTTSNSIYNGGTVSLHRQFSQGFSFQAAYTFSKVLTDAEVEQGVTAFYDINNRNLDRSVASFDVPQRVSALGIWEPPFLRGCASWTCKVAGGWQLSGYTVLEKGLPLDVITSAAYPRGDFNADGTSFDRPNAPPASVQRSGFTNQQFLNGVFTASLFPLPASGLDGTLPRNAFRGPGFARVDLALAKNIRFTERLNARLRLEAFNALNRVNLNAPTGDLTSNNFGKSTTAQIPRQIQVSLVLRF